MQAAAISLSKIIRMWQIRVITHTGAICFFCLLRDIQPGRIIKSEVICTPTRIGEKKMVAKLTSAQLKGISAEKKIIITN